MVLGRKLKYFEIKGFDTTAFLPRLHGGNLDNSGKARESGPPTPDGSAGSASVLIRVRVDPRYPVMAHRHGAS